jgi:hypothetical protein
MVSSSFLDQAKDIPISAAWKGGFASPPYMIIWFMTAPPPALPPVMVIFDASPPNALM